MKKLVIPAVSAIAFAWVIVLGLAPASHADPRAGLSSPGAG